MYYSRILVGDTEGEWRRGKSNIRELIDENFQD